MAIRRVPIRNAAPRPGRYASLENPSSSPPLLSPSRPEPGSFPQSSSPPLPQTPHPSKVSAERASSPGFKPLLEDTRALALRVEAQLSQTAFPTPEPTLGNNTHIPKRIIDDGESSGDDTASSGSFCTEDDEYCNRAQTYQPIVKKDFVDPPQCAMCGKSPATVCSKCGSIAYCSSNHASFDAATHSMVCSQFALLPPPEDHSIAHRYVIIFPRDSITPQVIRQRLPTAEKAPHGTYLKGISLPLPMHLKVQAGLKSFQLDHTIRITEPEHSNCKRMLMSRVNQSVRACTSFGAFKGRWLWNGPVVVHSYQRDGYRTRWLDCTAADFSHVVIWFIRCCEDELSWPKLGKNCPAILWAEDGVEDEADEDEDEVLNAKHHEMVERAAKKMRLL